MPKKVATETPKRSRLVRKRDMHKSPPPEEDHTADKDVMEVDPADFFSGTAKPRSTKKELDCAPAAESPSHDDVPRQIKEEEVEQEPQAAPKTVAKRASKSAAAKAKTVKPSPSDNASGTDRESIIARFGKPIEEVPEKKSYGHWAQKTGTGPAAPGSKALPRGDENCLSGLTFVFTGDLTSIARSDGESLVKRHGGRVTSAVSSKTSFLVVGDDPGASKMAKGQKLGIKMLDEDSLFDLIRALSPNVPTETLAVESQPSTPTPPLPTPASTKPVPVSKVKSPIPIPSGGTGESRLWTDKYRPRTLKDLCGNKGMVEKILAYLKGFIPGSGVPRDPQKKAVLISGVPGIGKTTAVQLACETLGFQAIEMNASDTRSKKSLDAVVRELTGNHTMSSYFANTVGQQNAKSMDHSSHPNGAVLVMDEVDGMSAGDRGGSAELIQIIKKSKVPIVCICNDRSSQKVRNLANYCLQLTFRRPDVSTIANRVKEIAKQEGLSCSPNALETLITSTNSDIRQTLNLLSAYRLSNTHLSFDQSETYGAQTKKHLTLGPFDMVGQFLNGKSYQESSFADLLDCYFHDYSLAPLFVQENYLVPGSTWARNRSRSPRDLAIYELEALSHAAEAISDGDLMAQVINSSQQWSLLPAHAAVSCVLPGYYAHGFQGGQYRFPGWLGKNSQTGKYTRLLRELQTHMRIRTSGDKDEVRQSYLPALAPALTLPLVEEGQAGIPSVMAIMDHYYLTKDNWDSVVDLQLYTNPSANPLKHIPTAVKSAFTRQYNSASHPTMTTGVAGIKRGAATIESSQSVPDSEDVVVEDSPGDEDGQGDEDSTGKNDDSAEADHLIKVKKPKSGRAGTTKGKTTAKGSGSRRGRGRGRGK
ncbi:DNA replication factor C complex subunit Rfc1 [Dispira parvispora]|uniref:Replication factor C subunit 1 n=1 Tax=Dispira parvispora TaxID=1520584 RepID=A0A9W8E710_9FUNG|nr:DNA replication factor C complex subunit Rfc1 [Dispira parvispora]